MNPATFGHAAVRWPGFWEGAGMNNAVRAINLVVLAEGDLVCFAAFGAGFTWGAALYRW